MLEVRNINASYGAVRVLYDLSFSAEAGQITCLLGRNGAGKSTTMKAIMGLLPLSSGTISLSGAHISDLAAHETPKHRIGYVPQGRRLFPELTVAENLEIGLLARKSGREVCDRVLSIFPRLEDRLTQRAGTLSGGEQQMLATARALCIEPRVLLLDEPTEGLQPTMIDAIRQVIVQMRDEGLAVILVEQRADAILELADKAVFIENGRNLETHARGDLTAEIIHRNLGV